MCTRCGAVRLSMGELVVQRQVRQRLDSPVLTSARNENDAGMPATSAPAPAPPPAPMPVPALTPTQPTALNLLLGPVPQCDFGHTTRPFAPVLKLAARSLGVCISEADIDDPGT